MPRPTEGDRHRLPRGIALPPGPKSDLQINRALAGSGIEAPSSPGADHRVTARRRPGESQAT